MNININPFARLALKPQKFQWLRFGEIRPAGWMRLQMQHDLEQGFVGHLDELVPGLILEDDIYGANRLTKTVRTKDLGVVSKDEEGQAQYLWWNSETQSNWRDGQVRTALLLEHPDFLPCIQAYIDHMLSTQDPDGYLGIYAPDLRFHFNSENGELWAQASLFRVLLGYYEATSEERVLEAVRWAVDVTMRAYLPGHSHPFNVKDDYAGVCHGLVFTDILDRLYQLTGQEDYLDYALWLYGEYSGNQLSADDIRYSHLINPAHRFKAHGVHTYEHLRPLLTAVYASGNPLLEKALEDYLAKLAFCLTPSGAPIGDESIGGRLADASETGYEYCSLQELLDSYSHLLQKTGDPLWAERIEWLLFNAGEGARHPRENAIAYLKTDNSFSMTGCLHPDDHIDVQNPQTRYKYSPAHQDVAVCCVPNAGRIHPYYVKAMWMRSAEGLAACLYGACELTTEVNGAQVHICESTEYPFDLEISFKIDVSQPVEFTLSFRKPAWARDFIIDLKDWQEENGWINIRKNWQAGQKINLRFEAEVRENPFRKDETFLSHGPLVFALPLEGRREEGRKYPLAGFSDLYYFPKNYPVQDWRLLPGGIFQLEKGEPDPEHLWETCLTLVGNMLDNSTHQVVSVRLIPVGGSILRMVTFKCSPFPNK